MSRFFRAASTVPDEENNSRLARFVKSMGDWGSNESMGYGEFFNEDIGRTPSPFDRPRQQRGPQPPVEPYGPEYDTPQQSAAPSPFFMGDDGKLYASNTTRVLDKSIQRKMLDEYIKQNPSAQAGVDAWPKAGKSHPGTPSRQGDWSHEKPKAVAQPAPVRASGGSRGGVPVPTPAPAKVNDYNDTPNLPWGSMQQPSFSDLRDAYGDPRGNLRPSQSAPLPANYRRQAQSVPEYSTPDGSFNVPDFEPVRMRQSNGSIGQPVDETTDLRDMSRFDSGMSQAGDFGSFSIRGLGAARKGGAAWKQILDDGDMYATWLAKKEAQALARKNSGRGLFQAAADKAFGGR